MLTADNVVPGITPPFAYYKDGYIFIEKMTGDNRGEKFYSNNWTLELWVITQQGQEKKIYAARQIVFNPSNDGKKVALSLYDNKTGIFQALGILSEREGWQLKQYQLDTAKCSPTLSNFEGQSVRLLSWEQND